MPQKYRHCFSNAYYTSDNEDSDFDAKLVLKRACNNKAYSKILQILNKHF